MTIQEARERTPERIQRLTEVWEASVRATHLFLTEPEILEIKKEVPDALRSVPRLAAAKDAAGDPVAFMGAAGPMLEMLFIAPAERGKGVGRRLMQYAVREWGVREVCVNEQNPQAVGFYERMGFQADRRSALDGQGRPYPLLHMRLTGSLMAE